VASTTHRFSPAPRLDQVPPAPRRPSEAARKLVFAYKGTQAVTRVLGVIFLVAGLALTAGLGWNLPIDAAIALTGAETKGVVLRSVLDRSTRYNRQHPYRVVYEYEAGGVTYTDDLSTIDLEPRVGEAVALEYATVAPRWSRFAGMTRNVFGWYGLLPLLVVALGAGLLFFAVRSNRREVRAFTHGRPVLARVTFRGQDTRVEVNERHPFVIRWDFRDPTGKTFEGALSSMDAEDLAPFGGAEEVVVLYDPADPRANTVYLA
jgi:hypothetical protein